MTDDYGLDIDSVGVPNEGGESWDELAERRRPTFDCALCGESHDSRGCAVVCCSARFDAVVDGGATDEDVREALASK